VLPAAVAVTGIAGVWLIAHRAARHAEQLRDAHPKIARTITTVANAVCGRCGFGNRRHHFSAQLVNLYGCRIGDRTKIGAFVEIQKGAVIGSDCKISSHSFICTGVTIEDGVFVGHGVMFINGVYRRR